MNGKQLRNSVLGWAIQDCINPMLPRLFTPLARTCCIMRNGVWRRWMHALRVESLTLKDVLKKTTTAFHIL